MTGDKVDKNTMVYGDRDDKWVASKVRMLMRNDLDHEAVCTGGRDRIMFLSQEVERQKADIAYLLDRARSAGSWGGIGPRDHGASSNAIVAYAYGGVVPSACYMPCDSADLSACYLAVEKMPEHRKTPEVLEALDRARMAVRP